MPKHFILFYCISLFSGVLCIKIWCAKHKQGFWFLSD